MVGSISQIAPLWGHLDQSADVGIKGTSLCFYSRGSYRAVLAPAFRKGSAEASVEIAYQFKFTLCLTPFPHFRAGIAPECLPTGLLHAHASPFPFACRACSPEIQPEIESPWKRESERRKRRDGY